MATARLILLILALWPFIGRGNCMKKKYAHIFLFLFFIWLLSPHFVFAAEMFFEQEKIPGLKDQFKMGIFLATDQPVNAIEGKINFPTDILELRRVEDGNSIINFWLERPAVGKTGEVVFSGITPGGYKGGKGLIFSLTFLVKQEGAGTFDIRDARVLQNDGEGTEATLQTFSSQFIISKKTTAVEIPVSGMKDADPPESFTPEVARNPAIFDGKWFVVFAAQDKASGIDRYEMKETRQRFFEIFSKWISAESPHAIQDQELKSYIFIKAIDKAGNERVATIAPRNPLAWYEKYENWIMIIGGVLVAMFIAKKLWKKRRT